MTEVLTRCLSNYKNMDSLQPLVVKDITSERLDNSEMFQDIAEAPSNSVFSAAEISESDGITDEVLLKLSVKKGDMDVVLKLIQHMNSNVLKRSCTPMGNSLGIYLLNYAVKFENVNLINELVAKGVDVNEIYKGKPVLHLAASLASLEITKALFEGGADLNAVDQKGNTVLIAAIESQKPDKVNVVDWLIRQDVDWNRENHAGKLPIHVAAASSSVLVEILVKAGCNVNVHDTLNGDTPLHCACTRCIPEAIACLILNGAHINSVNLSMETPLIKLLKYTTRPFDFHTRSRLSAAKILVFLGGNIGFLNNVRFPAAHAYRKCISYYKQITKHGGQVKSLQHISRLVIRECLDKTDLKASVSSLVLPKHLKQYLIFSDVSGAFSSCVVWSRPHSI